MRLWVRQFCIAAAIAILAAGCATTPPPPAPAPPQPSNPGVYRVGKPYQIKGLWYYPHEQPDYDETGIASWYGPTFYGKYTADGEIYDAEALTAAHPTLPMPVNVRVTNLDNGRSLILRVNDRGPFINGRVLDVTERAAKLLGFYDQGTAKVRVQFLGRADQPNGQPQPFGVDTPPSVVTAVAAAPESKIDTGSLAPPPGARTAPPPREKKAVRPAVAPPPPEDDKPTGKVEEVKVPAVTHLYVQVGAFGNYQNARRLMLMLGDDLHIFPVHQGDTTLYRVRLGPFDAVAAADAALTRMLDAGCADARILVDQ